MHYKMSVIGQRDACINLNDERHKLDVMKIKCSQIICGVTMIYRLRNVEVRRTISVGEKISDKVDWKVLKRLEQVERKSEAWFTK